MKHHIRNIVVALLALSCSVGYSQPVNPPASVPCWRCVKQSDLCVRRYNGNDITGMGERRWQDTAARLMAVSDLGAPQAVVVPPTPDSDLQTALMEMAKWTHVRTPKVELVLCIDYMMETGGPNSMYARPGTDFESKVSPDPSMCEGQVNLVRPQSQVLARTTGNNRALGFSVATTRLFSICSGMVRSPDSVIDDRVRQAVVKEVKDLQTKVQIGITPELHKQLLESLVKSQPFIEAVAKEVNKR